MKLLTTLQEIEDALRLVDAWRDPNIPQRQWDLFAGERRAVETGHYRDVAPFRAFIDSLQPILDEYGSGNVPELIDIGASSGYYGELINRALGDGAVEYTALDYSSAFHDFAKTKYPKIPYLIGDAAALELRNETYDIVVSGCCLLHMKDWKKAVHEAARVTRDYVIFHRTPILRDHPTAYWIKEAYDVPCFEIHFGQDEFYDTLESAGLTPYGTETVFEHDTPLGRYGHYVIKARKE